MNAFIKKAILANLFLYLTEHICVTCMLSCFGRARKGIFDLQVCAVGSRVGEGERVTVSLAVSKIYHPHPQPMLDSTTPSRVLFLLHTSFYIPTIKFYCIYLFLSFIFQTLYRQEFRIICLSISKVYCCAWHRGLFNNTQYWIIGRVAQVVKNLPAMQETWVRSLDWEDPLEEGMATHSSILAWRIPMDRGAWWAIVHRVTKNQTLLSS